MSLNVQPSLIGAVRLEPSCDIGAIFAEIGESLRSSGRRIGGLRQENRPHSRRTQCDMILIDIDTGRTVDLSEDRGAEARGCRLDRAALLQAGEYVKQSIERGVDLVILNKFGKAESEGAGLRDLIALALERDIPVLVSANAEHHPNLMTFAGDLAAELRPDVESIADWLDAVLPATRPPAALLAAGQAEFR